MDCYFNEETNTLEELPEYSVEIYFKTEEERDKFSEGLNKYRWRDLTDDPSDLPDDEERVLVATETKKGIRNYVIGSYSHESDRWCCGMNSNVIGWRYIEPLPEE